MATIRKSKRLSIYKKMLEYYHSASIEYYGGFCYRISKITNIWALNVVNRFPELMNYKPKKSYNNHWWSTKHKRGLNKRIAVLEEIIKEMSKKNK